MRLAHNVAHMGQWGQHIM